MLFIDMRGLFAGLRGYFVDLKGPCTGLRGHSYGLIIYVDPFRPKRAICPRGRACAALRGPSYGYSLSGPSFDPREQSVRVGPPVLRGPLVGVWVLTWLEYTQDVSAEKPFY